jgi:RNA polymerase sigma-70 factor (ECF subfamily)
MFALLAENQDLPIPRCRHLDAQTSTCREPPPDAETVPTPPLAPLASEPESGSVGWAEELELMARVQSGDTAAFEVVIGRSWPRTLIYVQQLVGDPDRAYDVVQETFMRLWQRRHTWEPTGSVKVWLYRTARNLVISEQRKKEVRARWATAYGLDHRSPPLTPLDEVERQELREAMSRAIADLSPRRREVFALFHLQDLSYREIAEIMSIRPQTVANYLQAALADLRSSLQPFFPALRVEPEERSMADSPQRYEHGGG